jgi:hypothetical protein
MLARRIMMDPISAELLMAVAGGVGGAAGQQAWNTLGALVKRSFRREPGHGGKTPTADLAALQRDPGDVNAAIRLAVLMVARAEADAVFRTDLETWAATVRETYPATGSGDVHNVIAGGVFHQSVIQARDIGKLTYGSPAQPDPPGKSGQPG